MAAGGDAYLAHEIFEDSNAPETFADFADRAGRFGLDYLGEAAVVANNEADLAPQGADSIRALSGGDRLKRETYIDIFSGRSFREALLVHRGRAEAPISRRWGRCILSRRSISNWPWRETRRAPSAST